MTKHNQILKDKHILVGIGGGIAAYKVCEVISTLFKSEAQVKVILTQAAREFITPLTVATLSRHRAYVDEDFWDSKHQKPLHIALGEWVDVFLLAPLTANTLGKLAMGLADNLLTNTVLASTCPILLAPAMNTDMWQQLSVQRNWQYLWEDKRYHSVGPTSGLLACDRVGKGRMAEAEEILISLKSLLYSGGKRDLLGKKALISGGGTREHMDPVRFIGNPSTGKMGIALAQAAKNRGANVTFVQACIAPELLTSIGNIQIISVVSAQEMESAMLDNFAEADLIIMSAAVGDFKPATYTEKKLPKSSIPSVFPLESTPDIVAELGKVKQPHQYLIGFAAQTGDILTPAKEKLQRKGLDAILANPVDKPMTGFGSDTNSAILLDKNGREQKIETCSKLELAHHLLDFVLSI